MKINHPFANDPNMLAGSGRFGSLIPAATKLFKTAWKKDALQPDLVADQADEYRRKVTPDHYDD